MRKFTKPQLILFYLLLAGFLQNVMKAQTPCSPGVPSFTINLTGSPAGVWTSPNISRNDQCCGVSAPDQCVFFNLTLDPNAAGIQIDMIGADPAGSLFYNIGCAGNYPGGTIKCISGVGPHEITFCKPGSNKNIYKITSISKPLFPKDDTVRLGCKHKFTTLGIVNNSVSWQSIYPGTPGQYNSYLDSTNVASPTYSPAMNAPAYVDYKVCGFPIASGCGFSLTVCDTVRIYNFPKLNFTVTPNPATFCNAGPGSGVTVSASASGGSPAYSYIWKNSVNAVVGTGSSYFATSAGNYNVTVSDILTDPVYCPAITSNIAVSQGTVPTVDAGLSQKKCYSSPLATLNGSVQFATGGLWSGGTGTFSPGNNYLNTAYYPSAAELAAGFVKLYLTTTGAGGSCTNKTDSTIIYYGSQLNVSIPSASIACFNGTTTLNSNVSGGTQPYSYLWNNGSTDPSINAGQGNFSLIVTDSLGCTNSANVNLVSPSAMNISFSVTNVSVNGGNDGSASVNISGGTPGYSVNWMPGSLSTFTINNLVYGIYTATVTDANGCKIAGSTIVNEPRCLGFTASSSATNVSCFGNANGVASVTVSGGTPAYTYTWNTTPAQTTSQASGLTAGVYAVVIADANSCYQTANVVITEPTELTNVMTHTHVTFIGGNNGAASANPFGGTSPYTYLWNFGATTQNVSSLIAGTYSVTVTDNKLCSITDNITITQPPCNGLTLNIFKNNVSCFGGSNGSALAVVSGATGSYTINWSTGATGPSVSNLVAGNYSVMLTNSSNCTEYINFTITQPSPLSIGLLPVNVSCNGNNNGSIDLTVSGGTYPYTYSWNNGSGAEDLALLGPSSYSVQVNDAAGCTAIGSAAITQPQPFAVTYTTQNVTCIYGSNGSIGLNVTGGTAPFTYTWSTGSTASSISGLTAGGYSVAIKDANNCSLSQPLIIPLSQPDSVKVDSFIVACAAPGSNQTQVTVVPQGGFSGAYQISFDNGNTYQASGVYTALLSNSTTYSVMVKDINACASLASQTLSIPSEVKIDSVSFGKCYSAGTGSTIVAAYPSGGSNAGYSVSYDNGISYLAAGTYSANLAINSTYTVIVKDNRNCISAVQIINLPAPFVATSSITSNYNGQNISCFGYNNGSATAIASGGTGTYSYTWSTIPTQTTSSASSLIAGTYTVIIKDNNNCQISTAVTLTQPAALVATASVTSNYNGQAISCNGYSDGSASVTVTGGTGAYLHNWSSLPIQTTVTATGLSSGIYTVSSSDINGCSVSATVSLSQPAAINATTSVISNYNGQPISCYGLSNGSASVTAIGGTGALSYSWSTSPAQLAASASSLSAGSYSVTIVDQNNCQITRTVTVNQPSQIIGAASVTSSYNGQNISCFGLSDGSASVTVNGGTGAYSYTWSTTPSQNTASASALSAGVYTVTTADINNCTITNTIQLNQPPVLSASATATSNYNGNNISCFGYNNGAAMVNASGGNGTYTYSWNTVPSQTNSAASGLIAGSYSVSVTDINNCSAWTTVTLTQPAVLNSSASAVSNYNGLNISCYGYSDGSASVNTTGGTSPYIFAWSSVPSQTSSVASNLPAGIYTVSITDLNNCNTTSTVQLTQPNAVNATVAVTSNYNGAQISCNGLADGSASVTVTGGTGSYGYIWSTTPQQTGTGANNLSAGLYSVTITDINNCALTKTVSISEPAGLTSSTSVTSNYNGQNISCYGLSNGSSSVSATGGTQPYTYTWTTSPAQSAATATNLSAGIYTVQIADINNCISTSTIMLTQPNAVNASTASISNYNGYNVSCFGSANGDIDITVNGGTSTYTFLWSNGATTQNLNGLTAGAYSVVASDINACTDTLNVILTGPTALTAAIDSTSQFNGFNISCAGLSNGIIYASSTGGAGSNSYLWSNGSTSQNLTNAPAGNYTLTVVDQNNCKTLVSATLTEPSKIIQSASVTEPLCNGVSNGMIDLALSGGVNPFVYSWSNGATTEDLSNISAGSYTVHFSDNNGCADSAVIVVTQPQSIVITKAVEQVKCYGDSTASVSLIISGGTTPYSILWSNSQTSTSLTALPQGTYAVAITDLNGCLLNDTTVITQPDKLSLALNSPLQFNGHNITFPNGTDGSITSEVSGGVTPYQYLWSNTETGKDLYNIHAGSYSVVVTDNYGCRVIGGILLSEPMVLEMPTAFSPNEDGKNDLFVVRGIEAYPQNSVTIYNRWGNVVYEKSSYNNEWNGNSKNGMALPDATYFVVLEINGGEKVLKGYVELRR